MLVSQPTTPALSGACRRKISFISGRHTLPIKKRPRLEEDEQENEAENATIVPKKDEPVDFSLPNRSRAKVVTPEKPPKENFGEFKVDFHSFFAQIKILPFLSFSKNIG